MSETPALPPAYRLLPVSAADDACREAERAAAEGADSGTLVWSRRQDRLDCAIILSPEQPLRESMLVAYPALLGLGDGLGAVAPPVMTVTFGWPDRLEVNGGVVGGVCVTAASVAGAENVPAWMVVAARVAIETDPGGPEPGNDVSRTTLQDEGCNDVDAVILLESFARHFLAWIDRWDDDGFGPVRTAWIARASGRSGRVELTLPSGTRFAGTFSGIADSGDLLLIEDGRSLAVELTQALRVPSWHR